MIMTNAKLVVLNGGERDPKTNAPVCDAFVATSNDATDEDSRIPFGKVPLMSCLGVTALPYAPDKTGHAEGILLENIGGISGVCVAGQDTRCASITANAKPGDTILHSTGPNQSAQVQLKEAKRQVVLATKKKNGKQLLVVLDGDGERIQVIGNKSIVEVNNNGDINLSTGASGIELLPDGTVHIRFTKLLLGGETPAFSVGMVPIAVGLPATGPAIPVPASPGIFICK